MATIDVTWRRPEYTAACAGNPTVGVSGEGDLYCVECEYAGKVGYGSAPRTDPADPYRLLPVNEQIGAARKEAYASLVRQLDTVD